MRELRSEYPEDMHIDIASGSSVRILRLNNQERYEVRGYPINIPSDSYIVCGVFMTLEEAQREAAAFILEQPKQ